MERTYDMPLRTAGPLAGVSHTKAGEWKDWYDAGADPEELPEPKASTLEGVRHYLRMADDLDYRKAAFRVAADRLEVVAGDLRKEAETMSPPTASAEEVVRPEGLVRGQSEPDESPSDQDDGDGGHRRQGPA